MIAVASAVSGFVYRHIDMLRRESRAWYTMSEAAIAETLGHDDEAITAFRTAEQLTDGDATLEPLRNHAANRRRTAEKRRAITTRVQELFNEGPRLRFRLLGFGTDDPGVMKLLERQLMPLHVFGPGTWPEALSDLELLGHNADTLRLEVEELLFFGAIALASNARTDPAAAADAASLCRKALEFSVTPEPWNALLDRMQAIKNGGSPKSDPPHDPLATDSARALRSLGCHPRRR